MTSASPRFRLLGQLAYGSVYVVVLPLLLVVWARRLAHIPLPEYGTPLLGALVAGTGLALMAGGTHALWRHGAGLPMSPFPPARLVSRGAYRIVADPIYVGAVLVSLGVSLAIRSAAGLWIVSPVLALSAIAFVLGFERDHTRRQFGTVAAPLLALPPAEDARPTGADRLSVYGLVFLPWLAAYMAVELLGVPPDAREVYGRWDAALPVIPWTEAAYALTYPFVLLAPLLAARRRDLRRFAVQGLLATALIVPLYLLLPLVATAKPVAGEGFWAALLRWERAGDRAVTAFPAFHVAWSCIAAALYQARWPRLRVLWWAAVVAMGVSCLTTGMHAAADVVAGFAVYPLVAHAPRLWGTMRRWTEVLANSWHEWTVGPVRILSHGVYAGLGAFLGALIILWLAGPEALGWVIAMVVASEAGAALWAQALEGSSRLLRPFGYFGSVIAVLITAALAGASGADAWRLLAAVAVGGTVTQAFGRLRCLVQGCCHGRPAPEEVGIRYVHPRSRVTRLTSLGGQPLHPTPLYSILWTLLVGAVLLRLWMLHAPLPFIVGAYFVLIGLGRFVEEHYRGEPQTRTLGGLRIYQWLSIAFVVGGAALTTVGGAPAPATAPLGATAVPVLLLIGAATHAAYGVDFPRANRRFARLV